MSEPSQHRPQPWPIRLTHWLTIPALVIMAGSGLQILMAFPAFGPRGALYRWYPLQQWAPPEGLRLGHWLAGAGPVHFTFPWLLGADGAGSPPYRPRRGGGGRAPF